MTSLDGVQTPKTRQMPPNKTALVAALDIGTSKIACLIARLKPCAPSDALRGRTHAVELIGLSHIQSRGVKAGAVVDLNECEQAVRQAVALAELTKPGPFGPRNLTLGDYMGCFDNGQLKGFRVPGSRFRRIPRDVLYKFMKENGIPTDALESGKRKALVVDDDHDIREMLRLVLEYSGRHLALIEWAAAIKLFAYMTIGGLSGIFRSGFEARIGAVQQHRVDGVVQHRAAVAAQLHAAARRLDLGHRGFGAVFGGWFLGHSLGLGNGSRLGRCLR